MRDVHAMLDLETLSSQANAAITAIGVVIFDPDAGQVKESFYQSVDPAEDVRLGAHMDANTVMWWLRQDSVAVTAMITGQLPTKEALTDLVEWLKVVAPPDECVLKPWGNGADFDLPIMRNAFTRHGMETPWKFYNHRCFRTLKALRPDIIQVFLGTKHNALDDARHQANHAIAILKALRGQKEES